MLISRTFKKLEKKCVIEGKVLKIRQRIITERYKHICPWLSRTLQTIFIYYLIQDRSGKIVVKYCCTFSDDDYDKIKEINKRDKIKVRGFSFNQGSIKNPNIRFIAETIKKLK